jgi:hypothetical protein
MNRKLTLAFAALLSLCLLSACGGEQPADPNSSAQKPKDSQIPASTWSAGALPDAQRVGAVRQSAKDGAELVVEGKVKDFVEGFAAFTLVDLKLKDCIQMGDGCPTPWDYCCTPATEVAENTITVEVQGEDGRPLRETLKGFHELDHLDIVQVRGKVQRDEAGNVRVTASKIARKKG